MDDDFQGFVTASLLRHVVEAIRQRGIDPGVVKQMLGIDLEAYAADPEGWVPVGVIEQLVIKSQAIFPNHLAGLEAATGDASAAFGVLGYLAQTCSTLEEIFTATARYERLVSDFGTTSLRHEPGVVLCCWDCMAGDELFRRIATDFILGNWLHHIRMVKEPSTPAPLAVHFRHSAPTNRALEKEYEAFFGCPVRFDQPESALVVPTSVMHARLRNPSPSLQETLERHARLLLSELNTAPSLLAKIRTRLRTQMLKGPVSREHLAGELGISARQLHRQLQKAGSTYTELVEDLRLELAKTLLQDPMLSVDTIAQRLSFEPPSFIRWFRQKVGQTPGDYRQHSDVLAES